MDLKQLRANYPHGAHEWLNALCFWLIEYKVFEKQPYMLIRKQLDIKSWLDTYYMECFSAKDAVIEDLKANG